MSEFYGSSEGNAGTTNYNVNDWGVGAIGSDGTILSWCVFSIFDRFSYLGTDERHQDQEKGFGNHQG